MYELFSDDFVLGEGGTVLKLQLGTDVQSEVSITTLHYTRRRKIAAYIL